MSPALERPTADKEVVLDIAARWLVLAFGGLAASGREAVVADQVREAGWNWTSPPGAVADYGAVLILDQDLGRAPLNRSKARTRLVSMFDTALSKGTDPIFLGPIRYKLFNNYGTNCLTIGLPKEQIDHVDPHYVISDRARRRDPVTIRPNLSTKRGNIPHVAT
jgi:hypothetical protein